MVLEITVNVCYKFSNVNTNYGYIKFNYRKYSKTNLESYRKRKLIVTYRKD